MFQIQGGSISNRKGPHMAIKRAGEGDGTTSWLSLLGMRKRNNTDQPHNRDDNQSRHSSALTHWQRRFAAGKY
jgi:hypothetical protein